MQNSLDAACSGRCAGRMSGVSFGTRCQASFMNKLKINAKNSGNNNRFLKYIQAKHSKWLIVITC